MYDVGSLSHMLQIDLGFFLSSACSSPVGGMLLGVSGLLLVLFIITVVRLD